MYCRRESIHARITTLTKISFMQVFQNVTKKSQPLLKYLLHKGYFAFACLLIGCLTSQSTIFQLYMWRPQRLQITISYPYYNENYCLTSWHWRNLDKCNPNTCKSNRFSHKMPKTYHIPMNITFSTGNKQTVCIIVVYI